MEMNINNQSEFINWADFLPSPQLHGGIVVALTSVPGGTRKTTLAFILAKTLKERLPNKKILFLDASFSSGLSILLDISLDNSKKINFILKKIKEHIDNQDYFFLLDPYDKLISLDDSIDYLPSSFPHHDNEFFRDGIPPLINKLRKKYDYIIIDTQSGVVSFNLKILATANHILVPIRLSDWYRQIDLLRYIDKQSVLLKVLGYPIDISGIIPFGIRERHPLKTKEYRALKKILGHRVWSPITFKKSLEEILDYKAGDYQLFIEEFIGKLGEKPKVRKEDSRLFKHLVFQFIYEKQEKLTSGQISKFVVPSIKKYLKGNKYLKPYQVSRCMDYSIFYTKNPEQTEKIFRKEIT